MVTKFYRVQRFTADDLFISRYGLDDLRTPVFIFERLCNLIFPVSVFVIFPNFIVMQTSYWEILKVIVISTSLHLFSFSENRGRGN